MYTNLSSKERSLLRGYQLLLALSLLVFLGMGAEAGQLGWIPMDEARYKGYLMTKADLKPGEGVTVPEEWDWRDHGGVTSAKDQAQCGSCWAFAGTGALESHILIEFGEAFDLSEQMLVSCLRPPKAFGCCGGELDAIRFYEKHFPRKEQCYPYVDAGFFDARENCPPTSQGSCYHTCEPVCYHVTNFYTLNVHDPEAIKRSIYEDGPAMVAFYVHEDFRTYWTSPLGTPPWTDGVYYQASGDLLGGHAILGFGWDDALSSYSCKNSWGSTSGPFGDGTFRIRTDQLDEAANFKIRQGWCREE